jgi:hypothetical protein
MNRDRQQLCATAFALMLVVILFVFASLRNKEPIIHLSNLELAIRALNELKEKTKSVSIPDVPIIDDWTDVSDSKSTSLISKNWELNFSDNYFYIYHKYNSKGRPIEYSVGHFEAVNLHNWVAVLDKVSVAIFYRD